MTFSFVSESTLNPSSAKHGMGYSTQWHINDTERMKKTLSEAVWERGKDSQSTVCVSDGSCV